VMAGYVVVLLSSAAYDNRTINRWPPRIEARQEAVVAAVAGGGGTLQKGGSGKASRAIEDVRLVFERNKGSIYAIYNRALRDEPSLQGKVVLKLTIAPGGNVVSCRIESTELHKPEVEEKLLARIRTFDFGAKDVNEMVVSYPLDFMPS